MHDVPRMRFGEGAGNLSAVTRHPFRRQWTFLDFRCQRRAIEKLHHQIVATDIVERANVRMVQRGDGLRFQLKASSA
jgi:hypothetical protein